MKNIRQHDRVRKEFSQQALPYSQTPSISDAGRLQKLVTAVSPDSDARVLDVACGPGYVALAFAEVCREVVGIDLTPEMLEVAESHRRQRQVTNASFQLGAAEKLPFRNQEFDVVVSRLALHHWQTPRRIIAEMARVCRRGGTIALEDLITSEHTRRASFQNRIEKLRDPSHTTAVSASALLQLLAAAKLEIIAMHSGELLQDAERWMTTSRTPEKIARKVRALLEQDEKRDLSGLSPFRVQGRLQFRQQMLTVVTRKL